MLTVLGPWARSCAANRRQFLQFGGMGLLGLNLPRVLAAQESSRVAGRAKPRGRAKSVIFLYLFGGPSQLETFDMKPAAPDTIRGPFKPIDCRTPGLRICEHLPKIAAISDRLCVLRTLTHPYTPKATGNWGRNHWSTLFPAVLAGGGIRGGMVYGRSDKHAAFPIDNPIRPAVC